MLTWRWMPWHMNFIYESFILILWFISKFLVTRCEQLLDPKELPKLKALVAFHLWVMLSLWCLCFLSLISVLSFFCIPVIKKIWQTAVEYLSNCTSVLLSDPGLQVLKQSCCPEGSTNVWHPGRATTHHIYRSTVDVWSEEYKSTDCVTVDCLKSQGLTPQEVLKIRTTNLEFVI